MSPVFKFGELTYETEGTQDNGDGPYLNFQLPQGVKISTESSFRVNLNLALVDNGRVWLDILDDAENSGMRFRLVVQSTTSTVRFRKKTPQQSAWEDPIDNTFDSSVLKAGSNTITIATTGEEYVTFVNGVQLNLSNVVPVDANVLVQVSKIQIRLFKDNENIVFEKDCAVLAPGPGLFVNKHNHSFLL